jgi:hypothetical protein
MSARYILAITIALTLTACGGGGGSGGGTTIATGQFKDSNTAGLSYVSGAQSGVTGADGRFSYEVGQTVTFSIGGVTIGTAEGKSIVTPVDLVSGGSSSNIEVQNIVRFLMMLDDDGDPTNGINIALSVQEIAQSWSQVDFTTADLQAELTSIISDAASADGGTHTLPDAITAQSHLESTLLCSYAGAFKGTYNGDDNGQFGILIDATTGDVDGVAYSVPMDTFIDLSGTTPISYDQNAAFVSGNTDIGATFSGEFTSVNAVSGTWQDVDGDNGGFSGTRIGGASDAVYRFTGNYSGNDFGLFSFDVGASNNITGVAYSVAGDELFNLNGTVSGTSLTASTSDGTTAISGTLDTSTGTLSGTWNDAENGLSGSFAGSGCKLN